MMCGGVIRIQLEGAPEFPLASSQIPIVKKMNLAERSMCFCQRAIDLQRLEGGGFRFRHGLTRRQSANDGCSAQRPVAIRKTAVGRRVARIGGDGLLEIPKRLPEGCLRLSIQEEASPQIVVVGLGVYWTGAREAGPRAGRQRDR